LITAVNADWRQLQTAALEIPQLLALPVGQVRAVALIP
jgi:hypothetical protein